MQLGSNQMYELLARIQFFKKNASESRSCGNRVLFLNASDLHAHVLRFNYHSNA